jgi:DNA-directed RNA polymerase specialized sigma24 family protein
MTIDPGSQPDVIQRYIAGDDAAGDDLCRELEEPLRRAVLRFVSPDDPDGDDVVQDVRIAFLAYLRRSGVAPDNPAAFAVAMAKNRCLNLHAWRRRRAAGDIDSFSESLPDIAAGPMEILEERQRRMLLQAALDSLD